MKKTVLLQTAYFGPVHYFSTLLKHENALIEQHDHYVKQSYRNRCIILSGNGPIALSIPVVKTNGNKTKVKDITVFNEEAWQKNHLRALKAAYHNSPFYEFYIDAFLPVWNTPWKYLIDLNTFILERLRDEMECEFTYQLSTQYITAGENTTDLRETIHPKIPYGDMATGFVPSPYHQVFFDRFPFKANLSILDLLFNKGPETADYLLNCYPDHSSSKDPCYE